MCVLAPRAPPELVAGEVILSFQPLESALRSASQAEGAVSLFLNGGGRGARVYMRDGQVLGAEGLPHRSSPGTARAILVVWLANALEDPNSVGAVEAQQQAWPAAPLGPLEGLLSQALERLQRLRAEALAPSQLLEDPEAPDFGDLDSLRPLPPELDELREVAARCLDINPLAVADLSPQALHDVITTDALLAALYRGSARFRPERYAGAEEQARATALALAELLRGVREALRDPDVLAMWLRELRRAMPLGVEPGPAACATSRGLAARARIAARDLHWAEALDLSRVASTLDPLHPLPRALTVCCQLALGLLNPADAQLNLAALVFPDIATATRTLRLARALLRPTGLAAVAERCLPSSSSPISG